MKVVFVGQSDTPFRSFISNTIVWIAVVGLSYSFNAQNLNIPDDNDNATCSVSDTRILQQYTPVTQSSCEVNSVCTFLYLIINIRLQINL